MQVFACHLQLVTHVNVQLVILEVIVKLAQVKTEVNNSWIDLNCFSRYSITKLLSTESLVWEEKWIENRTKTINKFLIFSQNGGSCYLNGTTGFACVCRSGFGGTCCEITLSQSNPCLSTKCENGGTCQVIGNAVRCVCNMGFLGSRCEQRVCDPNPCLYGGVCLPYGNSFICQCPPQYTGRCCELLQVTTAAPNPCTSQPCLNGGTCTATSPTGRRSHCIDFDHSHVFFSCFSAFVCSCTASYYGRCCEVRNYCQPSPW